MAGIKDIARELGLSVSTVSLALRDDPRVAEQTRNRVHEKAEELQYFPNTVGRMLKAGRINLIILIVHEDALNYYQDLVRRLRKILSGYQYSLLVATVNDENQEDAYRFITERWGDGVIVFTSLIPAELIAQYATDSYPIYTIGKPEVYGKARNFFEASPDQGVLSVTYLAETGHRRIAFVRGRFDLPDIRRRYDGYLKGLRQNGLEPDEEIVFEVAGARVADGRRAAEEIGKRFLSQHDIDAVFFANDELAIGGLFQFQRMGIRIPEDLSVIGQGNYELSSVVLPELTTEVADFFTNDDSLSNLIAAMIEQIEGRDPEIFIKKIPEEQKYILILRNSVKLREKILDNTLRQ